MIKSMTGFGRGTAGKGPNKIDVEIRTVNSRFMETKLRGFNLDSILELKVRNTLETSLQRGNVQGRVEFNSSDDSQKLSFNRKRFEILQDVVKKIHVDYGQRMNLSDIISTNDLLSADEPENLKPGIILKAVELALNQVNHTAVKALQTDSQPSFLAFYPVLLQWEQNNHNLHQNLGGNHQEAIFCISRISLYLFADWRLACKTANPFEP